MKRTNEEGVSPVVGVMLMLVVTIIIAAVVSGMASGLGGDVEKAPNAMFEVTINSAIDDGMGGTMPAITIEQLSGERIHTEDLQIITYKKNSTSVVKMVNDENAASSLVTQWGATKIVPILNDVMKVGLSGDNPLADFGNYTVSAGDIMTIEYEDPVTQYLGGPIAEGDVVDFKILHVPSESYLYDKEVYVV